jgi:hypothetical protein
MSVATLSRWTVAEDEGKSLVVRFRQLDGSVKKHAYPERMNVFWSMSEASVAGLPSPKETERLQQFEDRLCDAVEADGHSVLSVVLTCNGQREWVFHTADAKGFLERLTAMPQEQARYPIEIHQNNDPEWSYDKSVTETGT